MQARRFPPRLSSDLAYDVFRKFDSLKRGNGNLNVREGDIMQRRARIVSLTAFVLGLFSGWLMSPAQGFAQQGIPHGYNVKNVEPLSYLDIGEPGYKLAIQEVGGRWYLYVSHLWWSGWDIVDVTDPRAPKLLKTIEGPSNTWTLQIDLTDGKLLTPLQPRGESWGGDPDPTKRGEEGFILWDVSDPVNPKQLNRYKTGGTGSHFSFYSGGPYVHITAGGLKGFTGSIYEIVDWKKNVEVGRWWLPGQKEGEPPDKGSLHGPPYVVDNLAYISYGQAGMVIVDISDVTKPQFVGRLDFHPPFGSTSVGTHSVQPLKGRGLAVVLTESVVVNGCDDKSEVPTFWSAGPIKPLRQVDMQPVSLAGIVDIKDPKNPRLISILPVPVPPPDSPYKNFCEKQGRFGPHNLNRHHSRFVDSNENMVYIAYDNAGLRVFDISDARLPREVAYFIQPMPGPAANRRSPANLARGACPLCIMTEDVLVDTRGNIYLTDSNQGLWILRLSGR